MNKQLQLSIMAVWVTLVVLLPQAGQAQSVIQTIDAADKVGETLTVCGVVAGTHHSVKAEQTPFYVNLDLAWPESPFLLVTGGQDLSRLPIDKLQAGQPVCANGLISTSPRSGKPFILVMESEQLKLADTRVAAVDAVNYAGQFVTVYGKVASAQFNKDTEGRQTYLNLDAPYPLDPVLIVINHENRHYFGEPEKTLLGKMISVTGIVQKSPKGRAVIRLIWPSQLKTDS